MERAKNDIIETEVDDQIYFWSILEKENQSGILFNERLFFLQAQKKFGYISDPKATLTASSLSKAKASYPIQSIKSVMKDEKQLILKFSVDENNRKLERTWLMRAPTQELIKKWQDKLKFEKTKEVLNKTSPKLLKQEQQFIKNGGVSSIKHQKLSVNRTMTFSANPKQQKQSRQIGINSEPTQPLEPIKPLKLVETREFGTMMSSSNDVKLRQNRELRDANIGTSTIYQPKQSEPERLDPQETSRSHHQPGAITSMKSEPSGNKIERKMTNKSFHQIEQPIKNETKQHQTNFAQKNSSKASVPEAEVEIFRSKTEEKPVTPLKQDKDQIYYKQTSKLIKKLTVSNQPYIQPIKELPKSKEENSPIHQQTKIAEVKPVDNQLSYISKEEPIVPAPVPVQVNKSDQIRQQNDSVADNLEEVPWTFKYIKYREHMFQEFAQYTEDLLKQLLKDMSRPREHQTYQIKYIKNGVRYYEINDVEVKIAMLQLIRPETVTWNQREKLCSKDGIKILENQYNNYHTLYEYLGADSKLKVPLVCLNEVNGTVALFKIIPKGLQEQVKMREIESDLQLLKSVSKIDHIFSSKYLVPLDSSYYNKFKEQNNEYDTHISFDCVFIQELEGFLLPDTVTDRDYGESLLRKQLVELYASEIVKREEADGNKTRPKLYQKSNNKQVDSFGQNVLKAISGVIQEIDSLQVYFFNSKELSQYLHSKGINVRYLGHIYSYIKTKFQKQFIMSELASRSCKVLFRKTIQDLTVEEFPNQKDLNIKICDFFNCVLGNTYETGAIWKLLSSHCKNYFGLDINFDEIHKGVFLISLVENCKLDVIWERINPEEAFKTNFFFSERNLKGIKSQHKIYTPFYNQQFRNALDIVSKEESQEGYQTLVRDFDLETSPFPDLLNPITKNVKKYLAYFINPTKPILSHLQIYSNMANSPPQRTSFDLGLIEVKWLLKLKAKEKYIQSCDEFIQKATKFYGEFHPIFSELYDVFSAYHSSHGQYEDAITFAKSSLVNTLSLCGTHHQKTSQSYFYLGLYYLKASRPEEATHNLKKAKKILEQNNQTSSLSYGSILVKLALLHLNQNQMEECLTYSEQALTVLDNIDSHNCEDELTECYEMMARCFEVEGNQRKLREISQQISQQLQGISGRDNLEKMMKMFMYPVMSDLPPESASNYLDIISQLSKEVPSNSQAIAFQLIKDRIAQGNFDLHIYEYFKRINSIEEYIRSADLLKGWTTFRHTYQRQTVNDFVSLTQQLMIFLGEGFMTGALREAL